MKPRGRSIAELPLGIGPHAQDLPSFGSETAGFDDRLGVRGRRDHHGIPDRVSPHEAVRRASTIKLAKSSRCSCCVRLHLRRADAANVVGRRCGPTAQAGMPHPLTLKASRAIRSLISSTSANNGSRRSAIRLAPGSLNISVCHPGMGWRISLPKALARQPIDSST